MNRGDTLRANRTLVVEECYKCHMLFAMTREFYNQKIGKHRGSGFYCPAGHPQCYTGPSEKEKLRKRLANAQEETNCVRTLLQNEEEAHVTTKRQRNSLKGHLKKTKLRVGNGICPCCNRTFQNLARHMKGQHPAYSGVR